MILLAFFFPLAIYLLLLGFLNRGRHPLLVSGVWDGIGLIFGVSGFLLFAGPAILSTLSERWRLFWLLGKSDGPLAGGEGAWPMWMFLSLLYFLAITSGAAFYLWRQRRLTAIYNTDADTIQRAVADICKSRGLNPVCSGGLFIFERSAAAREQTATISNPNREGQQAAAIALPDGRDLDHAQQQPAILEVDSFPLMRHVTLRWEPASSPLRRFVEAELSRRLADTNSDDGLLGGWLLTLGFILLSFDMLGVFVLLVLYIRILAR